MPSAHERSPKALLVLVLALLGGSLLVRPRSEAPPSTAAGDRAAAASAERRPRDTTPPETDTDIQHRLRAPLADFLGVPLTEPDEESQLAALKQVCTKNGVGLEFIVACVPDPIDAVLGYRFDSFLDSVQRAVSTDGYVPDRYYLPWPLVADQRGGRGDELDPQRFSREPGALLFRRPPNEEGGWQHLLIIYLVGETSIYGIHKESFQRAVSEIKTLRELPGVPGIDKAEVRVLGPCFSGSAASLKLAIERSPAAKKRFRIVSGMVINLDPKDLPKPFLTTTVRIESLKQRLVEFVHGIHLRPPRIAWLTESNTGLFSQRRRERTVEIVEFTFPMNISRVRNTYEGEKASQAAGRARLVGEEHQIPLVFEDVATSRETAPQFTPDMTAVAVDRALDQLLKKIRQDRYGYVGITASDVRDKLFLADKLAESCPDARLLLIGADLLFTHESSQAQLQGSIVASAYPLYANNQFWSFPFRGGSNEMVFPSHSEQGVFNATILLRHPTLTSRGNGLAQRASSKLIEYGAPLDVSGSYRPPVWLSIVGRDGLLPISARELTGIDDKRKYAVPVSGARVPPSSTDDKTTATLNLGYEAADYLCLFAASCIAIMLAALRFSGSTSWLGKYINATDGGRQRAIRLSCVFVAFASVWTIATYAAAVAEQPPLGDVVLAEASGDAWQRLFIERHLLVCLPCWLVLASVGAVVIYAQPIGRCAKAARRADRNRVTLPRVYRRAFLLGVGTFVASLALLLYSPRTVLWIGVPVAAVMMVAIVATIISRIAFRKLGRRQLSLPFVRTRFYIRWRSVPPRQSSGVERVHSAFRKCLLIGASSCGVCLGLAAGCYRLVECNADDSWLYYVFVYLEFFAAHVAASWLFSAMLAIACLAAVACIPSKSFRGRVANFTADQQRMALWIVTCVGTILQSAIAGWIYVSEVALSDRTALFDGICWFERTGHLFCGASLLLPTALVAFAIFALSMASLKRLYIYRCERVPWPGETPEAGALGQDSASQDSAGRSERLDKAARFIDQVVAWPIRERFALREWGGSIACGLVATVYVGFLMWRTSPIPEGCVPSLLFWASLAGALFIWVFCLRAIIVLWQAQRELHKGLAELPLGPAFKRLPQGVQEAIKRFFWTRSRRDWTLGLMDAWRKELRDRYSAVRPGLGSIWAELKLPEDVESETEERKNIVAARKLWPLLRAEWGSWEVCKRFPPASEAEAAIGPNTARTRAAADQREAWLELAEDFMALYLVPYVSQFLRHWWNLVVWLMVASLLLLMAMACYPFEPQELLIGTCVTMIVLVGASAVFVEVQMEWDALLSQMMGTHPNRIDWNSEFVLGLLTWIVPVAIVLFTHVFPGAWTWFGGALDNLTRTLG